MKEVNEFKELKREELTVEDFEKAFSDFELLKELRSEYENSKLNRKLFAGVIIKIIYELKEFAFHL